MFLIEMNLPKVALGAVLGLLAAFQKDNHGSRKCLRSAPSQHFILWSS
jgi:hypothetical protein